MAEIVKKKIKIGGIDEIETRDGVLLWGGCDVRDLAREYGTPLYVVSEDMIRERCAALRAKFTDKYKKTSVAYASKAFLTLAMARIIAEEGFGLDLVSGGEMHVAKTARFYMDHTIFHGNAKSEKELRYALKCGVGRIVVDNLDELELLENISAEWRSTNSGDLDITPTAILLRVSPGVDSHTHRYIKTGGIDSKFGFPIEGDILLDAVDKALGSHNLHLVGFHFHIGSQILDPASHIMSLRAIMNKLKEIDLATDFFPAELNLGGGFGVGFLPGDGGTDPEDFTDEMMAMLEEYCEEIGRPRPHVTIEPGRWLVSEAGITLYAVESVKEIPDVVNYVAVDGGMTDNPRPGLYQAQYYGVVADRMDETPSKRYSLVGRCCESSDVLIDSAYWPETKRGDLIAVFSTGAYNHSMATNYNRLTRPAVVLVKDGEAELIVERENWHDLIAKERIPKRLTWATPYEKLN